MGEGYPITRVIINSREVFFQNMRLGCGPTGEAPPEPVYFSCKIGGGVPIAPPPLPRANPLKFNVIEFLELLCFISIFLFSKKIWLNPGGRHT